MTTTRGVLSVLVWVAIALSAQAAWGQEEPAAVVQARQAALRGSAAPAVVQTASNTPGRRAWADETKGALYVRGQGGLWAPAPAVHIHYEVAVTGLIARTVVSQRFTNPGSETVEAIYVYPLSPGATVDGLRVQAGQRIIVGEIQERAQAARTYERAKARGQRASLVEQERKDLFTTRISHILPGELVQVQLELQHEVDYEAGEFSLTLPTTLTPRYIPGARVITGFAGSGFALNTTEVPDASRISPPVSAPGQGPTFELHVQIAHGVKLASLQSRSHAIDIQEDVHAHHVRLAQGAAIADRDFRLHWRPVAGLEPTAALYIESFQGERYALLMVLPAPAEAARPLDREVTFVVDRSGSMGGDSMPQAVAALHRGLKSLRAGDTFNVIAFDDQLDRLFPAPTAASADNLRRAHAFADGLDARGGTEMAPALHAAFSAPTDPNRVQQVVFVTDGAVGNEQQLLALVHRELGQRRLFPVSIGSAPNHGFMREAARFGRGAFTAIGAAAEVQEQMSRLIARLEAPVLRDLVLDADGAEVYPARLPDLYSGQPLLAAARLPRDKQQFAIRGRLAGKPWDLTFPLQGGAVQAGVHKAWAARVIADRLDQRAMGQDPDAVRAAVLAVALRFGMVTPFTSLVAVDRGTPVAAAAAGQTVALANNPPAGSAMLGNMPQTATPAPLMLALALICLLLAFITRRLA